MSDCDAGQVGDYVLTTMIFVRVLPITIHLSFMRTAWYLHTEISNPGASTVWGLSAARFMDELNDGLGFWVQVSFDFSFILVAEAEATVPQ